MTRPLTTRTTLKGGSVVMHARTTLVLYHRDGTRVAQLERDKPIVVGRAAPSDVEIADPGLSRQHARFWWDAEGMWVEDLGSTNGTKKNGARITRTRFVPGDDLAIGPVRVAVHVLSSVDEELRGLDDHDRFVALLADELMRARTFGRPLALLMVNGPSKGGHVSRWADRLRARLRPVDRGGLYGPSSLLVSLPEAPPETVTLLSRELAAGDPPLTCHVAMFPEDGGSVDELLAVVRSGKRERRAVPIETLGVVATSPAMQEVMATVKRLATSTIGVLIHGETGTGKEVIAQAIHDGGPRKKARLRAINCAAIPHTLLESVLFGHEQGAFTGADKAAAGVFEQADGGTVFLDEIGELAASAQAALLRVLETKRVTRVGGHQEIAVDVRVIAATHRDLEAMVTAGRFRQDLLYRLNTMTLRIPPLRERVDEIQPLAHKFLEEAVKKGGGTAKSIDAKAVAALQAYAWPGNVRELRNVIERAVVLAEGKTIELADLTERVRGGARSPPIPEGPAETGDDADGSDYRERVRKFEIELILRALHKANGNQTEAAKALNLPLRTLVHKIQTYGIKKKFDR